MAFPETPLDFSLDLKLAGAYTSQSAYVRQGTGGLTVTRGKRDEASQVQFGSCTATLDNTDARYTRTNPASAIYEQAGRNTATRAWVRRPTSVLYLPHWSTATLLTPDSIGATVTCPDTAGLSITGDIELQFDGWLPDWTEFGDLIGKYNRLGTSNSYLLSIGATRAGHVTLFWSADGTASLDAESTVPLPVPWHGRKAIRATLDVNNGAAGNTVTFYISDTIAGTWTQLGNPVITAGTTSIFNGTAALAIGSIYGFVGKVYAAKVLQGIAGTVRANPDFTAQADGAASFADGAGNTWTLAAAAALTTKGYRFHGEASGWPRKRDQSGRDATVAFTASGPLRRLAQGKVLTSAWRRYVLWGNQSYLRGYWPCEDAAGSTSAASAVSGGKAMTVSGAPTFASNSDFVASGALPGLSGASLTGQCTHGLGGSSSVGILLSVPAAGITNGTVVLRAASKGSSATWTVTYTTGGNLNVTAYDALGASLGSSGASAFPINGTPVLLKLSLLDSGANADYYLSTVAAGDAAGATWSSATGTIAGAAHKGVTQAQVNPSRTVTDFAAGHAYVLDLADFSLDYTATLALAGYAGETAGDRVARLCFEEGVSALVMGGSASSVPMGAQETDTLLNALRSCERTDAGLLFESREFLGLVYRTGASLCAQPVAATLSYSAGDLSTFVPDGDDVFIANDVTASRSGGSSARHTVTTGSMSTQPPPDGVGTYSDPLSVNPWSDGKLDDLASWRAHLGTVVGDRVTDVSVNLGRPNFTGSAALAAAVVGLDVGDHLALTGFPVTEYPDGLSQLTLGGTENLNAFTWTIALSCGPQAPYEGLVWGDAGARWSPAGCTTAEVLDTTETGVDVANIGGVSWGHADGNYPIMIGGEVMTLTATTAAGPTQTLTVVRSVNGVVKTHATGAAVTLAAPRYWALQKG